MWLVIDNYFLVEPAQKTNTLSTFKISLKTLLYDKAYSYNWIS